MLVLFLSFFAITIVCLTIVVIFLWTEKGSSFKRPGFLAFLSGFLIMACATCLFYPKYKQDVENNAIMKFQYGEYEIIEKSVNGEVIEKVYKLIPVDYD